MYPNNIFSLASKTKRNRFCSFMSGWSLSNEETDLWKSKQDSAYSSSVNRTGTTTGGPTYDCISSPEPKTRRYHTFYDSYLWLTNVQVQLQVIQFHWLHSNLSLVDRSNQCFLQDRSARNLLAQCFQQRQKTRNRLQLSRTKSSKTSSNFRFFRVVLLLQAICLLVNGVLLTCLVCTVVWDKKERNEKTTMLIQSFQKPVHKDQWSLMGAR